MPSPPVPLSQYWARGEQITSPHLPPSPPGRGELGKRALLLAAVLVVSLCFGCGNPVNRPAAQKIGAMLPRVLGPAQSYDVKVSGSSLSFDSGHIGEVAIHGVDVAFSPQLTVDTLDADVHDIDLDTRSQKVTGMGPVRFVAGISAPHLNSYLAATAANSPSRPQNLAVQIADGSLALTFTVKPLWVNVPVSVTGMLTPEAGRPTLLDFEPTGARVSVVPVPGGLVDLALSHANPVVDLSQLTVPVSIDRTWIRGGNLYFAGTATIPASSFSHSS